jgi:hypothetical protein
MADARPLTPDEISRMLADKDQCQKATAYMNAMVMEAQQIENTRYKFNISNMRPES